MNSPMNHCTCSGEGRQGCVTRFCFFLFVWLCLVGFVFSTLCLLSQINSRYQFAVVFPPGTFEALPPDLRPAVHDEATEWIKLETALTVLHIFHHTFVSGALKICYWHCSAHAWIMDYSEPQGDAWEKVSLQWVSLLSRGIFVFNKCVHHLLWPTAHWV